MPPMEKHLSARKIPFLEISMSNKEQKKEKYFVKVPS